MTTLRELNREEWADKPYLIELRGGRADGQRFRWRELPRAWRHPQPPAVDLTAETLYPELSIALYEETGSVTDDGAHIYEFRYFE